LSSCFVVEAAVSDMPRHQMERSGHAWLSRIEEIASAATWEMAMLERDEVIESGRRCYIGADFLSRPVCDPAFCFLGAAETETPTSCLRASNTSSWS
jgi:hypothetical protein